MGKRVLLTGGTGLVGTDVLKRLVQYNYEVVCLSRRPHEASSLVSWVAADLSRRHSRTLDSLPSADHVVHAAAARTAATPDEFAYLRKVNVDFTERLFDWAGSRNVKTVVFLSGFNLLRRPLESVIDEGHPVAPTMSYSESKKIGEAALALHHSQKYFRGICLRLSSPIAFNYNLLHETVVKKWINQAQQRQSITVHGQGERTQDFVATEDIAAAVVQAIENPSASGTYNIASGTALSMLELAQLIATRWPTSIDFAGTDANEDDRWNISIDKARSELGYSPRFTARTAIERLLANI